MHVFLDSNVLHNNWFLEAAPIRYLAHYLNNEGHALLVSRLVIEEVQNLHRRALDEAYRQLSKGATDLRQLTNGEPLDFPNRNSLPRYDLLDLIKGQVDHVVVVEYENIPQSIVTARAMAPRRPFREKDRGYRDTLIWLSLLDHLIKKGVDRQVAFVTENVHDFMGSDNKAFHEELLHDLADSGLENVLVPFSSLSTFVKSNVDRNEHALDHGKVASQFSSYLERQAVEFVQSGDQDFERGLEQHLFPGSGVLSRVSPISADVMEGVEDLTVEATNELSPDEVFVSCIFDLRRVDLVMDIPIRDFHAYRGAIESSTEAYEVNPDGPVATVRAMVRPAFSASFTYNRSTDECRGFSVDRWAFVRRGSGASAAIQAQRDAPPQPSI
jgi:hypothetical protein